MATNHTLTTPIPQQPRHRRAVEVAPCGVVPAPVRTLANRCLAAAVAVDAVALLLLATGHRLIATLTLAVGLWWSTPMLVVTIFDGARRVRRDTNRGPV